MPACVVYTSVIPFLPFVLLVTEIPPRGLQRFRGMMRDADILVGINSGFAVYLTVSMSAFPSFSSICVLPAKLPIIPDQ